MHKPCTSGTARTMGLSGFPEVNFGIMSTYLQDHVSEAGMQELQLLITHHHLLSIWQIAANGLCARACLLILVFTHAHCAHIM